ncbi:MAG: GntR family transcriptional regulator [Thermodesulfobacteriota bacterium]
MEASKYRTMSEIAAETLKRAILSASYPPGTRLIPAKLEKDLHLGRIAIREALRDLACSGLVVSVPNKGAVVAEQPEMEEIEQIFEIRYLLEGKAAELATRRMTEECIERLEGIHTRMCKAPIPGHEYFALNREFHLAIYQLSGWRFLCQIITQLIEKVYSFRTYYPFRSEDFNAFNKDHEEIIRFLRSRNPDRVSRLVVRNVERGFETLEAVYDLKKRSARKASKGGSR